MSEAIEMAVKAEVDKRVDAARKAAEGYLGLVDHGYPINVYEYLEAVINAVKGEVVVIPELPVEEEEKAAE